jgi:hypothetical protein
MPFGVFYAILKSMSINYAESKVREALAAAKGNHLKARKILDKMCKEDHRLLSALTAPHMTGILAHAVERISSKMARGEPITPEPAKVVTPQKNDGFGKELLKNFAFGTPPKFAQEEFAAPIKKTKASQSHISAIHLLAGKKKPS